MHLSRPAGRELGERAIGHASTRMEQQPHAQTSTAGRLTAPAAAAQRPVPLLSSAHISSARETAMRHEVAAAPSASPAAVRIPIPPRTTVPAVATRGESSVSAAPAAAPVKTEGQTTAAAPKQSGSKVGGPAAAPAATVTTGASASHSEVPPVVSFVDASHIQSGHVLAVLVNSNSRAQLYIVDSVGDRGVWGRTLQSAHGQGSKATYLPLVNRVGQRSSLMLVTAVTQRASKNQMYFSLEPLPSRESVGANSFLDEDGLYRHAKLLGAKQQSEASALRRDGKPRVQFGGLTAAYLSKFILPEDYYKVHLHGDPQRAVTIPTIITLSPVKRDDFDGWVVQAQTGDFFREEGEPERLIADACQGSGMSSRKKINSQDPVLRKEMCVALDSLIIKIREDPIGCALFFPESANGGPPDDRMTISQVQRNLAQGLYDHDLNLQYAEGETAWATFVAPVRRLLTDMAQVWLICRTFPLDSEHVKLILQAEGWWQLECTRQGGLLREIELAHRPKASGGAAAEKPGRTARSADADGAVRMTDDEVHCDSSSDWDDQSDGPSSSAAAAHTHSFVAAAQKLVNNSEALRRANQELKRDAEMCQAQLRVATDAFTAQQRRSHELNEQVKSLLAAALAAAPQTAQLDQARATIAERDAELVRAAAVRLEMEASNDALQSRVAELQQQLDGIRKLAQPKRARDPDADDDSEPPRARRRFDDQQQEQKQANSHGGQRV